MKELWFYTISHYSAQGQLNWLVSNYWQYCFIIISYISKGLIKTGMTLVVFVHVTPNHTYYISNTEFPLQKIISKFNTKTMTAQLKSPLLYFSASRHVFSLTWYLPITTMFLIYFKSISNPLLKYFLLSKYICFHPLFEWHKGVFSLFPSSCSKSALLIGNPEVLAETHFAWYLTCNAWPLLLTLRRLNTSDSFSSLTEQAIFLFSIPQN